VGDEDLKERDSRSAGTPGGGSVEGLAHEAFDGCRPGQVGPGEAYELVAERSQSVLARLLRGEYLAAVCVGILHQSVELEDDPLPLLQEVDASDQPAVPVADLDLGPQQEAEGTEQKASSGLPDGLGARIGQANGPARVGHLLMLREPAPSPYAG